MDHQNESLVYSFLHETNETQTNIIMETLIVMCHSVIITSPGPVELLNSRFLYRTHGPLDAAAG
jgi:hypothetical protein